MQRVRTYPIYFSSLVCKEGVKLAICSACNGEKHAERLIQIGPGMFARADVPCEDCRGTGENVSEEDKCQTCKGEKIMEDKKDLSIKLDPGVPPSHVYTVAGEGHEIVIRIFQ